MTRELLQQSLAALEWHTQQTRPIHNTELAIDAIRAALAQPAEPVAVGWQAIETAPKGRKVLVGYANKIANWRTVMACYYLPQTLQMEDDRDDLDDDGYAPEGWYEECESQDNILPTDMPPTHWRPLPPPPGSAPESRDCRTCNRAYIRMTNEIGCRSIGTCTEGNMYAPLPAIQLWGKP